MKTSPMMIGARPMPRSSDFGAAPSYKATGGTNVFSLLTVLAQLGPDYSDGFVIDVGPFPGSGNGSTYLRSRPGIIACVAVVVHGSASMPPKPAPTFRKPRRVIRFMAPPDRSLRNTIVGACLRRDHWRHRQGLRWINISGISREP